MTGLERRQTPRTTIQRHAYINIEPNNGGIVLDVSDGGLCFHSFDPVQRNGTIRFWFSDHNQRIEADGALAWMDETQKGGLRFTALPADAREKIRGWMSQPATPRAAAEGSAPAGQPPAFPTLRGGRPDIKAAAGGSAPLAVVSPELKVTMPLSGFSRGLATGLLVSAVVVAAFLFHNYRREFGESLIQLGERFAAKPQAQPLAVSAAASAMLPAAPRVPPVDPTVSRVAQTLSPARASIPVPEPERLVSQPLANQAKPEQAKLEAARPAAATPTAASDPAPKAPATAVAAAASLTPPAVSSPTTALTTAGAPGANLIPDKLGTAPRVEAANQFGVHAEDSRAENTDATRELYFEVGKFKNQLQAHDEADKLAQLGFPATAVQRGFLWTNSYHVLVGPYGDEEHAKVTHENLVSTGFKPRPFERGSRSFTLLSSLTLDGARTPEGDYTISWESYIGDASVKFVHNNYVVATADGRWVKREVKYGRDAYVYKRNADGSRTLLEIHFEGMRQALVFGKSS